ncbi:hypothetical protein BT67DRAFT_195673 [Trichocladium antarcticum]|uniref:Uncharacterized protein n=1 Tax=Trichocladium antarcticum TaxID=1450529 RepID=A0AAN6ZGR2_9PEZI|nr:hypothetical protein BT67DRAFT_195673 [Trichocladium antarcticum]
MSGACHRLSSLGSSRPDRRYSNAAGPSQSDGLAATSARISSSEGTWPTSPTRQSEGLADLELHPFHVEPRAPFFQHGLSQHPPPMFMAPIGLEQASFLLAIPYQEYHGETGQGVSNHDSDGLGEHLVCSMDVSPGSYGSSGSNPPEM